MLIIKEWLREVCAKKTIDLEYIENYITSISSTKGDMMPTKKKFKSAKERKYEIKESADRKLKSKIINEKPVSVLNINFNLNFKWLSNLCFKENSND